MTHTFIIREAPCAMRSSFKAAGKPWGLYIMKIGRRLHEIGHFATCEQAVSLATVLADTRSAVQVDRARRN